MDRAVRRGADRELGGEGGPDTPSSRSLEKKAPPAREGRAFTPVREARAKRRALYAAFPLPTRHFYHDAPHDYGQDENGGPNPRLSVDLVWAASRYSDEHHRGEDQR